MTFEVVEELPSSGKGEWTQRQVQLAVEALPTRAGPVEVRLAFEFDTVPPGDVVLTIEGEKVRLRRAGPAVWRVKIDPARLREKLGRWRLGWLSPPAGSKLVEVSWATAADDDRLDQFTDDLERLLKVHGGSGPIERDRRFFLELDFVTRLLMDGDLRDANQAHATGVLGIPVTAFGPTDLEICGDLKEDMVSRPFKRAQAIVKGGGLSLDASSRPTLLEAIPRYDHKATESVGEVFVSLIDKHYGLGDEGRLPSAAGLSFLRFSGGRLRREERLTPSEATRAFNCEPDGFLYPVFAEFADAAGVTAKEDRRDWWFDLLRVLVASIHVFGDAYWNRKMTRRREVYVPESFVKKQTWSNTDLKKLMERSLAWSRQELELLWGLTILALVRDDPELL